jgi:hypothetical protein
MYFAQSDILGQLGLYVIQPTLSLLRLLFDRIEVRMIHRVLGRNPLRVVVSEHELQQVKSIVADERLVLRREELGPRLLVVLAEYVVVVAVKRDVILLNVGE